MPETPGLTEQQLDLFDSIEDLLDDQPVEDALCILATMIITILVDYAPSPQEGNDRARIIARTIRQTVRKHLATPDHSVN